MLLVACSSTTNSVVTYKAYTYSCCVELTPLTTWNPGERLTLHWQSRPTTTTNATAESVILRLKLTGPFTTIDQLKSAITKNHLPVGVRTIDTAAVTVSDRSGGSPASELDLPIDLAPGYYNLDAENASVGSAVVSGAVVRIQP